MNLGSITYRSIFQQSQCLPHRIEKHRTPLTPLWWWLVWDDPVHIIIIIIIIIIIAITWSQQNSASAQLSSKHGWILSSSKSRSSLSRLFLYTYRIYTHTSKTWIQSPMRSQKTSASGQDRGVSPPVLQSQYWSPVTIYQNNSSLFGEKMILPQQIPTKPMSTFSQRIAHVNFGSGASILNTWRMYNKMLNKNMFMFIFLRTPLEIQSMQLEN